MTNKISPKVYGAIIATGLMSFAGVIVETSMNITFPTLMREYDLSTNTVQWMTSIYLLVVSIIVPLSAILKSSFRIRHLFMVANLLFLTGLVIDACAPSFPLLLLSRAIQGGGTGITLPLMFNIILEQVPQEKIGMMGLGNMITGIAPALGPTFGGFLVSLVGWRWIFYTLIPVLVFSLFLGLWGIQQKAPVVKRRVDLVSLLAITCLFTGFIFGFSNLSDYPLFSWRVGGAILLGIVAIIVLVWRSAHLTTPILNFHLFANRIFGPHLTALFLIQMISLGCAFLIPNYIQLVNHQSAFVAGVVVLPAGIAGAIMGPLGGRLLDRYGARRPIITGALVLLASIIGLNLLTGRMTSTLIAGVYLFYMGGMGTAMPSTMTDALANLPTAEHAQGNALINTAQQFAGAMGTSLVSAIVALSQTAAHSKGALPTTTGTQHAFILLTVFALTVLFLLVKSVPSKNK